MGIAKTFVSIGTWIEKHFPEKLTAAEVALQFRVYTQSLDKLTDEVAEVSRRNQSLQEALVTATARVSELEKKSEVYTCENNKVKLMLITQRQTAGR